MMDVRHYKTFVVSRVELEALRDLEGCFKMRVWLAFEELWEKAHEDPDWDLLWISLRTERRVEKK